MKWINAGGLFQLKFMGLASKVADGKLPGSCPKCGETLRFYYHKLRSTPKISGTIWVWCGGCLTWSHISRIDETVSYKDPYENISPAEFKKMEEKGLLDLLEKLWSNGQISADNLQ